VKLTINGRFTVDISHDRLVMRFSRIKDSGMEWFYFYFFVFFRCSAKGVQPNGLQKQLLALCCPLHTRSGLIFCALQLNGEEKVN